MKHRKLETSPEVSKRMRAQSHKKSKVESILAKALWHKGYRYRLNYRELPGTPDIAITKYQIAIFVDGEFWHGKDFESRKNNIINNKEYWSEKIQENMDRDDRNDFLLRGLGWTPIHIWSKDVLENIDACINVIDDFISYQLEGIDSN